MPENNDSMTGVLVTGFLVFLVVLIVYGLVKGWFS